MTGTDPDPMISQEADGVSVVLTSCGRFDLLEKTLASFFHHNTYPIDQFIIVEDSASEEVRDVVRHFPVHFDLIINECRKGQIASLDLAYSRVTNPLVFHCEDDWLFLRPRFIEDSIVVLNGFPQVSMVNMVCPGILVDMDEVLSRCPIIEHGGVRFRIIPPDAHELWFGYSFNPGLRRTAYYRSIGSFAAIGHEADLSLHFKNLGMSIASLERPAYTHIGETRHVQDSVFPISQSRGFRVYWRKQKGPAPDSPRPQASRTMVSVVVPVHNAAESLAETLSSIQNQTCAGWEAIIVDDGSTDGSLSLAQEFARGDGRFRVFSQTKLGASAARNTGIHHTTSDWLLFLDADDGIAPVHLERMTGVLGSRPELDGVVCQWKRIHPEGELVKPDRCSINLNEFFPETVLGCPFAIHACVVRKRSVEAVTGFNTALATCEDWHFWQKISRTGAKFAELEECLAFYRMRPLSMSRNARQQFQDAIKVIEIGLGPDHAVTRPLPQFEGGAVAEYGDKAKSLALAFWGGMLIWQGEKPETLLGDIGSRFTLRMDPGQLIEILLIGAGYAACRLDPGWLDEWPRIEAPILDFVDAIERFTDSPELARRTRRQIRPALKRRGFVADDAFLSA